MSESKYVGYLTLNEFILVGKIKSLSSSHIIYNSTMLVHEALWALTKINTGLCILYPIILNHFISLTSGEYHPSIIRTNMIRVSYLMH